MESLFDKLSNGSGLTLTSRRQGLQTIMTSCHCFCQKLCHRRGPDIHPWTLAQVGVCPKEMKNTSKMPKNFLLLGHHLRRQARASKLSWRPNPCQVRVYLRLQEQSVVKRTPKSHMDSVFDDPHLDGQII
jgi:hypothetical protein